MNTLRFILLVLSCPVLFAHINIFCKNDFGTCLSGAPDYVINITEDGLCRELIPAYPTNATEAIYYESYTDTFTGSQSAHEYVIESIALLSRCGCEKVINRRGFTIYNESCYVDNLYFQCERIRSNRIMKKVLPVHFNDNTLVFWGIDYTYIETFMLY